MGSFLIRSLAMTIAVLEGFEKPHLKGLRQQREIRDSDVVAAHGGFAATCTAANPASSSTPARGPMRLAL